MLFTHLELILTTHISSEVSNKYGVSRITHSKSSRGHINATTNGKSTPLFDLKEKYSVALDNNHYAVCVDHTASFRMHCDSRAYSCNLKYWPELVGDHSNLISKQVLDVAVLEIKQLGMDTPDFKNDDILTMKFNNSYEVTCEDYTVDFESEILCTLSREVVIRSRYTNNNLEPLATTQTALYRNSTVFFNNLAIRRFMTATHPELYPGRNCTVFGKLTRGGILTCTDSNAIFIRQTGTEPVLHAGNKLLGVFTRQVEQGSHHLDKIVTVGVHEKASINTVSSTRFKAMETAFPAEDKSAQILTDFARNKRNHMERITPEVQNAPAAEQEEMVELEEMITDAPITDLTFNDLTVNDDTVDDLTVFSLPNTAFLETSGWTFQTDAQQNIQGQNWDQGDI